MEREYVHSTVYKLKAKVNVMIVSQNGRDALFSVFIVFV